MKKMWGARFQSDLDETAKRFSYSLAVDHELLGAEIKVSTAHAKMLGAAGIISAADARTLVRGLAETLAALKRKSVCTLMAEYEDIHSLIHATLQKKVGSVAKKLHTARSRNDLVATSTRLYLKGKMKELASALVKFQSALVGFAERNREIVIPGYTHLQRAQLVLLAHHVLAYVEMCERDKSRLSDAKNRLDECPLGAGALAGSGLPINRHYVSNLLGFKRPVSNSLDAVSDRDFVVEVISAIAVLMMHLSRFAEDVILWSSQEFEFVRLDDRYSTGSSLMPQKKNPDMLELIRGKTGDAYGYLVSSLVMMKGLPLAYNRDMQQDKRPLFASIHLALESLLVLEGVVRTLQVERSNCERASRDSFLYATDVLEYLVKKKVPFRDAHDAVGGLVQYALATNNTLSGLPLEKYRKYSKAFAGDVYELFDPRVSVSRKVSQGGTSPKLVNRQIHYWKKRLRGRLAV